MINYDTLINLVHLKVHLLNIHQESLDIGPLSYKSILREGIKDYLFAAEKKVRVYKCNSSSSFV